MLLLIYEIGGKKGFIILIRLALHVLNMIREILLNIAFYDRQRTPSGSTTPVRSGQQTAVTRLLRKPSDSSEPGTPTTPASRRGTPASSRTTEKREPFRL